MFYIRSLTTECRGSERDKLENTYVVKRLSMIMYAVCLHRTLLLGRRQV